MGRFLIHRFFGGIFALFGLMVLIFFLLHLSQTSPAAAILGRQATPQKIAALNAQLGLNLPVLVQFLLWVKAALWNGGIGPVIVGALPPTLELLILGVALALVVTILLATLQTRLNRTLIDRGITALLGLLSAIPGFWLGSLLLFVFAISYPILPPTGFPLIHHGLTAWLRHEVLPVVTLALTAIGPWTRHLRASLDDSSTEHYVRTARAKGVPERAIIPHHTMKNSLLPLITLVGLSLPTMLNTVIAIEIIYAIPGAGKALIGALDALSFANATTVALVLAFITVLGGILTDVVYGLVDPRLQYQ